MYFVRRFREGRECEFQNINLILEQPCNVYVKIWFLIIFVLIAGSDNDAKFDKGDG